ncbi:MAG: FliM/FliN family flagellar motor switch protein [Rhodoblastus sp.]|nr:FliM/FliN family flagellar motor switch protein [Rhodoblastus sp.]
MSDQQVEFDGIPEPEGNQRGQVPLRDGVGAIVESIPLTLRIVLGSVTMPIREVSRLRPGSLVTLDRRIGEPVEIVINDRVICRGHISVSEEPSPRFVIKIVDLVEQQDGGRASA